MRHHVFWRTWRYLTPNKKQKAHLEDSASISQKSGARGQLLAHIFKPSYQFLLAYHNLQPTPQELYQTLIYST